MLKVKNLKINFLLRFYDKLLIRTLSDIKSKKLFDLREKR